MTLRRIEAPHARLLKLAVQHDIPARMEGWIQHLDQGQLTEEMQEVLEAFGYLEKRTTRQRRPKAVTPPEPEPREATTEELLAYDARFVASPSVADPNGREMRSIEDVADSLFDDDVRRGF